MRLGRYLIIVLVGWVAVSLCAAGGPIQPDDDAEPIPAERAVCKQGNWSSFPGKQQCIDQCDKTSGYPYCHTVHVKEWWWWETWCICKNKPQNEPVASNARDEKDVPQTCISPEAHETIQVDKSS